MDLFRIIYFIEENNNNNIIIGLILFFLSAVNQIKFKNYIISFYKLIYFFISKEFIYNLSNFQPLYLFFSLISSFRNVFIKTH